MTSKLSSSSSGRRRRSSSRRSEAGTPHYPGGLGALITIFLLAVILATGPLILGAARLWVELPLLGGVALVLLVQGLRLTGKPPEGAPRRADAIDLAVVLFVLYAIVRWLTSPTEYFSRIEALDVVGYAGVFFTCRHGMANRKHGMLLLYLLVVLGVGETAFGYYLSNHLDWFPFGPAEHLHVYYAPRWLGTYGCPNHYACLLVMAIGAALAMGSFSKLSWPMRIVLFYVSIMMMVGVMYSGSRGSWVALLASICALVIMGIRNGAMRWWVPVSGAVALVAVCVFMFSLSPVVRERLAEGQNLVLSGKLDTYVRIELARDALRIAHDYPLFGTGPGTFVFIHPRYQDSTFAFKAVLTHDDYLNCLDDYGLVGFFLAMFFVAAVTLKFFRPLELDHRWQDRVLVATGFAAWMALLAHSWVDFNLHIPANALWLFALTGVALGRFKEEAEVARHWSTLSLAPLGRWLGWGVVVLSLVYGAEVARTGLSDIGYEEAFARADEVPVSESIQGVEDALVYDRGNAQALMFLGDLYRYKASRQSEIEGRLSEGQKALDAYQKALRANTLDDSLQGRMGMAFDVMRRYPEAFFCYKQAVTAQPYNGQFWFRLGNHYWERGMLDKAEEAYLMSEYSPHGGTEGSDAEQQLRRLPEMEDVPRPAPGTNPLAQQPEADEPAVVP
jgi:tetratricopeptide (TPR) repeat protein